MTNARLKTEALRTLVRAERNASAEVILALVEFHRERLWAAVGYNCLFSFLHRELGYSKGAASYRNAAVELVAKYPQVVDALRDGRLCLSVITELAHVATAANIGDVLPRFFGLSKLEAKMLVAELAPKTHVPRREVITSVASVGMEEVHPVNLVQPIAQNLFQPEVEPMTSRELRMHITVSVDFYKKLEAAKNALSHKYPHASSETILSEGLDLVLKDHAKRKGLVEKPRKQARTTKKKSPPSVTPMATNSTSPSGSNDHIPAAVRRTVWIRDGGKCQYPIESGDICGSERRTQLDHFPVPRARGGPSTAENLRLVCRGHNLEAAKQIYGAAWMSQFLVKQPPEATDRDATTP